MNTEKLSNEQMLAQAEALLAPYRNGIAVGEQRERERIITLLQNQCKCTPPDEYHPSLCTCQEFIAIIKGESK